MNRLQHGRELTTCVRGNNGSTQKYERFCSPWSSELPREVRLRQDAHNIDFALGHISEAAGRGRQIA